ncbi:MAG: hypothetical protein R3C69_03070 [Geminicoccaceae bacterium]
MRRTFVLQPLAGSDDVVEAGREGVLGGQAIGGGRDGPAGAGGERADQRLVLHDAADDPAAAIDVEQDGQLLALDRLEHAHRHRPAGAGGDVLLDGRHLGQAFVPEGGGRTAACPLLVEVAGRRQRRVAGRLEGHGLRHVGIEPFVHVPAS